MIGRIWHGYTSKENADRYESLLKEEIFVGIKNLEIDGFTEIQLFRRNINDEVEFITIMWFDTLEAVKRFAGEEYKKCVVLPKAKELLKRYDLESQHYYVKEMLKSH